MREIAGKAVPLVLALLTVLALGHIIEHDTRVEVNVEHAHCEAACHRCHHLCLECKAHLNPVACQLFAACETGCSGATCP